MKNKEKNKCDRSPTEHTSTIEQLKEYSRREAPFVLEEDKKLLQELAAESKYIRSLFGR